MPCGGEVTFERVYAVWDYYDGPREGLADYRGQPHYFKNQWDEEADDWSASFTLIPIDAETLDLAMEQWAIWRMWEQAFHGGQVQQQSHPGYGGRNPRYDELETILEARIPDTTPAQHAACGVFRVAPGQQDMPVGVMRELEVEWRPPQ
jgi:hypothetical protein